MISSLQISVSTLIVALFVSSLLCGQSQSQSQAPSQSCSLGPQAKDSTLYPMRRVPAEWELQESIWMQWPKLPEYSYRENFSAIIDVVQEYEPLNIIVGNNWSQTLAKDFLRNHGVPLTNIEWHIMSYDWAWMRDNGPVWIEVNKKIFAQDWGFDGWGGLVGYWGQDDIVPPQVAAYTGVPCEDCNLLVNERGTLEFNGTDALITSWPVLNDRNPGWSQPVIEENLKRRFGVSTVVWLLHGPSGDLTKGHVDGIARFIDVDTVAVGRYVDQNDPDAWIFEEAATIVQNAGFNVVRVDIPGYVTYKNTQMAANYMNWLVGNGFVAICGFGQPAWDAAAKSAIEGFFPGRDVFIVEVLELWFWGGGVHCVTNDQPTLFP